VETIGSKRSYALTWCMPNNDEYDDDAAEDRYCQMIFSIMLLKKIDQSNIFCFACTG